MTMLIHWRPQKFTELITVKKEQGACSSKTKSKIKEHIAEHKRDVN